MIDSFHQIDSIAVGRQARNVLGRVADTIANTRPPAEGIFRNSMEQRCENIELHFDFERPGDRVEWVARAVDQIVRISQAGQQMSDSGGSRFSIHDKRHHKKHQHADDVRRFESEEPTFEIRFERDRPAVGQMLLRKRQSENKSADNKKQHDPAAAPVDDVGQQVVRGSRVKSTAAVNVQSTVYMEVKDQRDGDEAQAVNLRDKSPGSGNPPQVRKESINEVSRWRDRLGIDNGV